MMSNGRRTYDDLPDVLAKVFSNNVTDSAAKTWTFDPGRVTHRALHDRQMWRRRLAMALYRLGDRIDGIADRVDPWHEDDEWFTAAPLDHFTFKFTSAGTFIHRPEEPA